MISIPRYIEIIDQKVYNDITHLMHDMREDDSNQIFQPIIEISLIELNLYFDKWTYHINYNINYNNHPIYSKQNINFYTCIRDKSLDNKIEQYLDNYLTQSKREEKLNQLGI
jgi:hypothetical protein